MQNVITVGKRLIPVNQIAFIETFDPAINPEFKPEKAFLSRLVLKNRDTVLAEIAAKEFVQSHGFRWLAEDDIAINASADFAIELFAPSENFNPTKPYASRLKWRDGEGNDHSKLLLTAPDALITLLNVKSIVSTTRRARSRRPTKSTTSRPGRGPLVFPE